MDGERHSNGFAWWPAVAALTLLGLALRIAAARGALWTDEAWSVVYAMQARDPLGVFLRINHDNNHHLNTLWLQAVGMRASPLVARGPAILAGTLAIPVAALLFARRSAVGAIAAAALFAVSPMMVTYGSGARGYGLMILATLVMIFLATDVVEGRAKANTKWLMALTAAFGMLSHITMLAPVGLICLWIYLEKRSSAGTSEAIAETLAIAAPAIAACAGVLALILVPALLSATGMQTGGYNPPSFRNYTVGLSNMESWAAGFTFPARWLAPVALLGIGGALLMRPPSAMGHRARLYGLLVLGVPAVILIERIGNAQFARFYLSSAIGLLLLGAEWAALAAKRDKAIRALAGAAGILFVATSFWHDGQLIELQRGQDERAIALMKAEAPRGAPADIATQLTAPMTVAAAQADYPLALKTGCAPVEFMIVSRTADSRPTATHCGEPMRAIAWSEATDLTGDSWVLYRASTS